MRWNLRTKAAERRTSPGHRRGHRGARATGDPAAGPPPVAAIGMTNRPRDYARCRVNPVAWSTRRVDYCYGGLPGHSPRRRASATARPVTMNSRGQQRPKLRDVDP